MSCCLNVETFIKLPWLFDQSNGMRHTVGCQYGSVGLHPFGQKFHFALYPRMFPVFVFVTFFIYAVQPTNKNLLRAQRKKRKVLHWVTFSNRHILN